MGLPPQQGRKMAIPVAVLCSAALHFGLVLAGGSLLDGWSPFGKGAESGSTPAPPPAPPASPTIDVDLQLPPFKGAGIGPTASANVYSPLPAPGFGGEGIPRPDTGVEGRGGTDESTEPAVNLADRDDGIRLTRDVASHIRRDQVPRIHSSKTRQSWEDGRWTTRPMELVFLASGEGERGERRPPAPTDPSSGVMMPGRATVRGAIRIGAEPQPVGWGAASNPVGGASVGGRTKAPGAGVVGGGLGTDHRRSADVAFARPMVRKGPPSIPSDLSGRPRDTVDSDQEVAATIQSIIHASTAGGRRGHGPGGVKGPGATASGGKAGKGSRSQPLGHGVGPYGWRGHDPGLSMYRRKVLAKLWPLWEHAFPKWAIADLRQGQVIIALTILGDGRVHGARVKRSSGLVEFDKGCLAAVNKASPFEPLPRNLGLSEMRWEISFDASNPIVRP